MDDKSKNTADLEISIEREAKEKARRTEVVMNTIRLRTFITVVLNFLIMFIKK